MALRIRTLGVLVVLVSILSPVPAASHYHQPTSGHPCVIPAHDPINVAVEEGWQAVIECKSDGTVEVYYQAEQAIPGEEEHEYEGVERAIVGSAPSHARTSDIEAASTRRSEKGCRARSTQFDVIGLDLTWFSARIDYRYDTSSIRSVRGLLEWWARTTENSTIAFGDWHRDDYEGNFLPKVKGKDGTWRRQALEAWADFSFDVDDRWPHRHEMVVQVGRTGNCRATDKFSGEIVPAGYQVMRVRSVKYEVY